MKYFLLIIAIFFSFSTMPAAEIKSEVAVRGCEGWGFFAEFLWALNHIDYCIKQKKTPMIYWDENFSYYSPNGYNNSKNCWEYYFEPVSLIGSSKNNNEKVYKEHWYDDSFSAIINYPQYIANINKLSSKDNILAIDILKRPFGYEGEVYPVKAGHLYSKEFRQNLKKRLMDPYIKIKKPILTKIEDFYNKNMAGKRNIGIHLRGSFLANEVLEVPLKAIFEEANRCADLNTQFFIATDQIELLEKAKKELKGKVIFYVSERFETTSSPVAGQKKLDPLLGENVLIETMLLSMCHYFVHTISNVSTAALYFNPHL